MRYPSIFLTNLCSIKNKFDDLRCQVSVSNPDVVICSETWLSSSVPTEAVTIPGYRCFRADRVNDSGRGGVAVWAKTCLRAQFLRFPTFSSAELCATQIPSCRLIIVSVYLPPGIPRDVFNDICCCVCRTLDDLLNRLPKYHLILAGDFNRYDLSCFTSGYSLHNIVTKSTRKNAILDMILVETSLLDVYSTDNVEIGAQIGNSDHNSVFAKSNTFCGKRQSKTFTYFDTRLSNITALERRFLSNDFNCFYASSCDIDTKCNIFYKYMKDAMTVIPQHVVFLSNSDAPWMSPYLKHMITLRWNAFRSRDWNEYNILKVKVKDEIIKAKRRFFVKKSKSVKGLWSFINMERGDHVRSVRQYDR